MSTSFQGVAPLSLTAAPDLILDVTRAADPRRVAEAMRLLERGESAAFAKALEVAHQPRATASATYAAQTVAPPPVRKPLSALQQMEGFFLRQFLENVLPRSEALFGQGQSGDLWRSMMAEKMGETLARQGSFGIAERLARQITPQEKAA